MSAPSRLVAASLALLALATSGCVTVRPRTEAIVDIAAEPGILAIDPILTITVSGGPSVDELAVVHSEDAARLGDDERVRLTILPANDDASRVFAVEVFAVEPGGRIVGRQVARGRFLEGRTTYVTLTLEDCCRTIASSCRRDETCDGCACVPAMIVDPTDDAGPPPGLDAFTPDDAGPEPDTGLSPDAANGDAGRIECSTPLDCPARACESVMCNRTECVYTPLCEAGQVCCNGECASNCDCLDARAGTICRRAQDVCDLPERCDGRSGVCPVDVVQPTGSVPCRPAVGPCDADESCDGVSVACPPDGFAAASTTCPGGVCNGLGMCASGCTAGAPCAPPGQPCALGRTECPSGACVAMGPAPAGTPCAAAAGACDVADTCNGTSMVCPSVVATAGTPCRPAAGGCDLDEVCNGTAPACPADLRRAAGITCRASAGGCDVAESCDGLAASCPADAFVTMGTECSPGLEPCGVPARCSGTSAVCPPAGVNVGASCGICDGSCSPDGFCVPGCGGFAPVCCESTGSCMTGRDYSELCPVG